MTDILDEHIDELPVPDDLESIVPLQLIIHTKDIDVARKTLPQPVDMAGLTGCRGSGLQIVQRRADACLASHSVPTLIE